MNKYKTLFLVLLISMLELVSVKGFAQTDKILVDLAEEMYSFGDYEDALGLYLQAIDENPENVKANYQAGECYLRTTQTKKRAVNYFLKAYEIDPEYTNMILFQVAESYRFAHDFDNAIKYYKLFKEEVDIHRRIFVGMDLAELKKKADRRIFESENAEKFMKEPTKVNIENLGDAINSESIDYAPVISRNDSVLIFTSRRKGGTGLLKDKDNEYFEDLWMSYFQNNKWSDPVNMGQKINTDNHESNLSLSPLDNKLYIYKSENSGDIFYSELKNGVWQKPVSMGEPINSKFKEHTAIESEDGSKLFITSNRPGGMGGIDIYMAERNEKGKWGELKGLSDVINTDLDEEGPFFISETNMLYFSSKGHKGMGGYDVYRSKFSPLDGSWSEPENLGYPINSTDDDLYFMMAADGKTGYYASFKEDSRGESDLYRIYPADGSEETPDSSQETTKNLAGVNLHLTVVDAETSNPIVANIELINKLTDEKVYSGEISGALKYNFKDSVEFTVIIIVESESFLFQTVKMLIPAPQKEPLLIEKTVYMRRPKENVANIMKNVYFDFNKARLKKPSYNEINKLVKLLKDNPNMKVEIGGHSDFIGGAAYNKELSRQRASAVRDYVISKEVQPSRISAVGYGSERPLASNDDEEEGRELNRRTEFRILSK